MSRKKHIPLTPEQMEAAMKDIKSWRCYNCRSVFTEECKVCPKCRNWTIEPVLDFAIARAACPTCGAPPEHQVN